MRTVIFLIALMALPAMAAAADDDTKALSWKPSITESGKDEADQPTYRNRPPPPISPLNGPNVRLTPKESHGVRYGRQWANNPDVPARGDDGGIVFIFGSTLPVVVCAPLYVCDLQLQPGEVVNDINVGDGVRWQLTPATQGAGDNLTTHVMIKPTDIGLITNLVITTDRRAYTIKLVSQRAEWMPRVSFHYPQDVRDEWSRYRTRQDSLREASLAAEPVDSSANLDFAYSISGDSPSWRPIRVYSNGAKTYIQFPSGVAHGDLPALVALGDDGGIFTEPSKQLVNYRYVHGRFEVDRVLDRAALISGVGWWDQVEVKISRQGRR
jgi:type IV secretion system protein VirB9